MQQCYYDVQKALSIDESHSEATRRMAGLVQRADEHEKQAVRLGAVGKHTDALRHMSAAIEINPSVCDFYILRSLSWQWYVGDNGSFFPCSVYIYIYIYIYIHLY